MWAAAKTILDGSSSSHTKCAHINLFQLNKPQLEKDTDVTYVKEIIKNLIASPITRNQGLLLLYAVMNNNPRFYINNWASIVLATLKCPDDFVARGLTLKMLILVVENFSSQQAYEEVFQRLIPEIVSYLLETNPTDEYANLSCRALAACQQHLPSVIAPYTGEIEAFLVRHAASIHLKSQEGVAKCFAALPLCLEKAKGKFRTNKEEKRTKGISNYSEIWVQIMVNLEGLPVLVCESDKNDDPDDISELLRNIKSFLTLSESLSEMMSVHLGSNSQNLKVEVPVDETLYFIERIFSLKESMKGKPTEITSYVIYHYPSMLLSALNILESLIINFTIIEQSKNFAALLLKLFTTILSSTSELWKFKVRSAAWKVIDTWLKHYGPRSSYELVTNKELINELLKDVTPDQENGLSQSKGAEKSLPNDSFKEEACAEALNVLCSMFIFGGSFMDKESTNKICNTVFMTSCKVQQPTKKILYPYTNNRCRLNLYKCLLQASLSDPLQTKYIKQTINIFKLGIKDSYLKVNTVCYKALNILRFYISTKRPLPESVTLSSVRVQPKTEEESAQPTGWENGFSWNAHNESSHGDRSMDVSPPCRIESAYHNSMGSDGRRDVASPVHYAEAADTQCNGSNQMLSAQPSHHSSVCNDSVGSGDYKSYDVEEDEEIIEDEIVGVSPPVPVGEICATKSEPTNRQPQIVSLKPAEVEELVPPSRIPEDYLEEEQNGMEGEEEEEENSEEEEGEENSEEEDENNESFEEADNLQLQLSPGAEEEMEVLDRSAEDESQERAPKRPRMNTDEASSEEEEEKKSEEVQCQSPGGAVEVVPDEESEEDQNPDRRSPTLREMCEDFVLAEPEEL